MKSVATQRGYRPMIRYRQLQKRHCGITRAARATYHEDIVNRLLAGPLPANGVDGK
ncbi:hypothetical protein [Burkholderia stagnalis]|uniref:hypothetical protein n=1 Tax=Burkholderia stagnalis TaxID=1503054 RepID=UPI000ADB7FF0|nr:hypothetical protein [Burkholderia stagnalis]